MFTCPRWRIERGADGRQLDQMDAAGCLCKERPDIGPFVASRVVPDDMPDDRYDARVGATRFDLGMKLHGTDPINAQRLDKRCIESLKVHSPMKGHTTTSRRVENCWIRSNRHPAKCRLGLAVQRHRIRCLAGHSRMPKKRRRRRLHLQVIRASGVRIMQ